eukprot:966191-Pelagomonas_calceolata.AAC.2
MEAAEDSPNGSHHGARINSRFNHAQASVVLVCLLVLACAQKNSGQVSIVAPGNNVVVLPTSFACAVFVHMQVLAGALKDAGRASIVASENSFGKGLIQTIVNLPDGSGLAITVAK